MFTLGDVHISEVFLLCKRYKWDGKIVFTLGGVHISKVFSLVKDINRTQKMFSHKGVFISQRPHYNVKDTNDAGK